MANKFRNSDLALNRLKIVSYNCNSLINNIENVRQLTSCYDIVLLQETMISSDEIHLLDEISDSCFSVGSPSVRGGPNQGIDEGGRSKGGFATLWNKSLGKNVSLIYYSEFFNALRIDEAHGSFLLVNVYLPFEARSAESLSDFRFAINEIKDFLTNGCELSDIVITGDFNADPHKGRFWNEVINFANNLNLSIHDLSCLSFDSFTYLSPSHNSTSWLDHVISNLGKRVLNVSILYDISIYDHFPISFEILASVQRVNYVSGHQIERSLVDWPKMSSEDIELYSNKLDHCINHIKNEGLDCRTKGCSDPNHKLLLRNSYEGLIGGFHVAAQDFRFISGRQFNIIPGWNEHCRELYQVARQKFLGWKLGGKLRIGESFENMKNARRNFKRALDYCKSNELKIRNDRLLSSLRGGKSSEFWKTVGKENGKAKLNIAEVDGVSDPCEMVELFSNKFKTTFVNPDCAYDQTEIESKINEYSSHSSAYKSVSLEDVGKAVKCLNYAIGNDAVHTNHIRFGSLTLFKFLSRLFSSFIEHSYLPPHMTSGEIRPIIKNKFSNKNDSSNFRPIMISSVVLKVFEYCLLAGLRNCLSISPRQFGYREGTSTLDAVFCLKETILSYTKKGSHVFACFLDLSKAFDRVNYSKLINKLISNKVPLYLVKTIFNLHKEQEVRVSFNGIKSSKWFIRNGVRQGGILSPLLFNMYINEILEFITGLGKGCMLGLERFNIVGYADDICIISPSKKSLINLVEVVIDMLGDLELNINMEKTSCMIFGQRTSVINNVAEFNLNSGQVISRVSTQKYLGVVFRDDLKNVDDIARCEASFYRQFNCMFRRFGTASSEVLLFLFRSYCANFYGAEVWYGNYGCSQVLRSFACGYHRAIKKIFRKPRWESNHDVCNVNDILLFDHFLNKILFRFTMRILSTSSPCLFNFRYYFKESYLMKKVKDILITKYNIGSLCDNDFQAILSRIKFVQSREESSLYP